MKKYILSVGASCLVAAFTLTGLFSACSDDAEGIGADRYISLSGDEFTFDAEGEQTFTVTVTIEPPVESFEVENNAQWLNHEVDGNKIIFSAESPNYSNENLTATVKVSANGISRTISFTQLHAQADITRLMKLDKYYDVVMSPNGRYLGAVKETLVDGSTWDFTISVYDAKSGEWTECETTRDSYARPVAVSDNGSVVVREDITNSGYYYTPDGTRKELGLPDGGWQSPQGEGISADGSIIVGSVSSTTDSKEVPVKWVNGVPELLPLPGQLPDTEMAWKRIFPRGCSADGSIIYGNAEVNWDAYVPVIWYADGTVEVAALDEAEYTSEVFNWGEGDVWEITWVKGVLMDAERYNISSDGRYLACTYYEAINTREGGVPCVYDIETKTLEKTTGISGCYGWAVTDDKILTVINPQAGNGYIVDMNDGSNVTAEEWFHKESGLNTGFGIKIERLVPSTGAAIGSYTKEGISSVKTFWYLKPRGEK